MKPRKQDQSHSSSSESQDRAQPVLHQRAEQTQDFGEVTAELPLGLPVEVRKESIEHLNQILADTMTLRDLYKKSHWQVSGPTFYQLHLLYDKHYTEQIELVDEIADASRCSAGLASLWHMMWRRQRILRARRAGGRGAGANFAPPRSSRNHH